MGFLLVPLMLWITVAVFVSRAGELLFCELYIHYVCMYIDPTTSCDNMSWQETLDQLILSSFSSSAVSVFILAIVTIAVIAGT